MIKEKKIKKKITNQPWRTETSPLAIGLSLVRSTFASIFLSIISLYTHPALLIKTDPTKNKNI